MSPVIVTFKVCIHTMKGIRIISNNCLQLLPMTRAFKTKMIHVLKLRVRLHLLLYHHVNNNAVS